ncbi:MAG: RsmB/NOP family class I SAM-dependent RNA methyltransferase [Desulfobacterales bacterium]|nr:RsmB/NOP family class I SAM-dependent RNA methyltransferase [Desulfobacterales bacterium]
MYNINYMTVRYSGILDDPQAFTRSLARPLDRFLWINADRTDLASLRAMLARSGFETEALPWHPTGLRVKYPAAGLGHHWAYRAGLFQIQEAGSMLPVLVMDPRPGERILDLCAAPGNKTAQIALALENRGTVVSNDVIGERQRATRMMIDRLGLANVTLTCMDGVNYPRTAGVFDAVLVDAPCTCEGTSRRNPARAPAADPPYASKARKQKLLLRQAIRRCARGGRIVYSTCTYAPEENEAVVDAVMREWPGAVRILPSRIDGMRTAPGLVRWQGRDFHPDLRSSMRVWPHQNDTAGFYVALLEKTAPDSPHSAATPRMDDHESPWGGHGCRPYSANDPLLVEIRRRFGLSARCFDTYCILPKNRREICMVAADHRPPVIGRPPVGLPFLRVGNRYPKLTTAAAMVLGAGATRNCITLTADQLGDYLARRAFAATSDQIQGGAGGYVMIRYQGFTLGLGCLHATRGSIESLYPKNMAVDREHLIA